MLRAGGRLFVLLIMLAVISVPAFLPQGSSGSHSYEPTRITNYVADFDIADNGDVSVVERISVDFPEFPERHGIFRFWDTWDPSATFKRRIPRDIKITEDGRSTGVEMSTESRGRQYVARIGREYSYMSPGIHEYVISYTIKGVIEEGNDVDTPSQFYWNLIPGGWNQQIDRATLRVNFPARVEGVDCAVGLGSTSGCSATGDGRDYVVRAENLPARTPVTIKAGVDMATPDTGETRLWPYRWDAVFGSSTGGAVVVLGLAILAGLFGWRLDRRAYEEKPPYPLQYGPPPGMGPAQAAYLLTEGVPRQATVASLLHMSEEGLATLERNGGTWTLTNTGDQKQWDKSDEVTRGVASRLMGTERRFTADPKDTQGGKTLKVTISNLKVDLHHWATREGLMVNTGLGSLGGFLVALALAATLGVVILNPFSMTMVALIPGLFAVGALYLMLPGSGTVRTAAGREMWSKLGGFRRMLSTPSSEDRFDFSGRKELYTAYIPWAVAFGVADKWAAKYRTEVGEEPPVPSYFGGYYGYSTGSYVDAMVSDFDSTIQSSISSYEASIAPQSSGGGGWSGGGGGFSGGFGGGGGGGGSW